MRALLSYSAGFEGQGHGVVVQCPFQSYWVESEGGQGLGGVLGMVSASGGDVPASAI